MPATRILPLVCLLLSLYCSAQPPRLVLPLGHPRIMGSADYSYDDKYILTTGSVDGSAKIWEARSGKLLHTMSGHDNEIMFGSFTPDNKYAIINIMRGGLKMWEVQTGQFVQFLDIGDELVKNIVFSPDSKFMVAVTYNNIARGWELSTGKVLFTIKAWDAWFNKTGKFLLITDDAGAKIYNMETTRLAQKLDRAGGIGAQTGLDFLSDTLYMMKDEQVERWQISSGKRLASFPVITGEGNDIRISPNGNLMAIFQKYDTVRIYQPASGQLLNSFYHKGEIKDCRFSPDGSFFATASMKGTAQLVNTLTGAAMTLHHTEAVWRIAFSHDGKYLVTASFDNSAKIWDTRTGKEVRTIKGSIQIVSSMTFDKSGKYIATDGWDNSTKVWDHEHGRLAYVVPSRKYSFSKDGKYIVTADSAFTTRLYDIHTGKLVKSIPVKNDRFDYDMSGVDISESGKLLLAGLSKTARILQVSDGKELFSVEPPDKASVEGVRFIQQDKYFLVDSRLPVIGDTKTGKILFTAKKTGFNIQNISISPSGRYLGTSNYDSTIRVWEIPSGKEVAVLKELTGHITYFDFSPDDKHIATTSADAVSVWNLASGKIVQSLRGHESAVWYLSYSPSGNYIASSSVDKTIRLWDSRTGKLLQILRGHQDKVGSTVFHPDEKFLLSTSFDATCKTWDLKSGKEIISFNAIGYSDHFARNNEGYYLASPGATKLLHYVTKDLKIISFEQLDVRYNRPDKILRAIGNSDTVLIRSYRKAWEKRIKKLGIDTTTFRDGYSVPECDFVNREVVEYEQKSGTLSLHIRGRDSAYKLDRFNIWVNESPLYGQRGIRIRKQNSNSIDTTITIILSQGENRIETSISNVNGTESYRMPLYVNYSPAVKQKETTRFIGIGIDRFADPKNNLQYSSKDIRDLAIKLKEKYKDDIIIDTLFNEDVTAEKVKGLKKKLQQSSVNDKVIISYSGHGLLSKDYDYYLSTYSVNFDKPEENGLPYDELENLLDSIPARKKLMLIDACHSGEVDKEEMTRITAAEDGLKVLGAKGGKPTFTGKTTLGMKNSFELMQSLFVNVGKSTGATIISAAAGTQFALERGDLKNGVFTYCILEAMEKNPTMKISELKRIVGERVEQLTNGLQKPTSRNETIAVDWNL